MRLGELLREVDVRQADLPKAEANALEVLSLTKNDGLILQSERFGKRIATDDTSKYKVVREEQIVYNPYGIWEGAVHALRKHRTGLVSPVYSVWETIEPDGGFVDYLVRTPPLIDAYNRVCSGAVNRRRSIREEAFAAIKVTVPPLRERQAVSTALRVVQRAKEATEKVIAATRQLKTSLMKHLFTYGPVPFDRADHVPLRETEMGAIPEHWPQTTLGELCSENDGTIQTGPFGSQLHKSDYVADGVPVVNPTHLLGNRINHIEVPCITETKATDLSRHRLRTGDMLFARRGEIGRHGFVTQSEEGWHCGTGCFLVRVNHPKIFNAFLPWYFSRRHVVDWLDANAGGAIMPNLNNTTLARLPVLYPELREQRQIAEQLSAVDANLAAKERRREALDALFKSVLHHLMTGKLRLPEFAGGRT